MDQFIILPDVTCDLSPELREAYGLSDYVPSHITINGKDVPAYLDWSEISRESYYKTLSDKKSEVTTAPPSPEEYYRIFSKYAEDGVGVLSMSISSKISSTYGVAKKAAERVRAERPDALIYCFDSFKMTGAFGLLVLKALSMQKNGVSFDGIVEWLEANKHRVHQMGPIDDLIFVARRGRISMGKAIMGNFAGVKPMGDCNRDGYTTVLAKAKGMKKALAATVEYVKRTAQDPANETMLIAHSDRDQYASELKEALIREVGPAEVLVTDVFSASGGNIGPGMVGVYFFGKELTDDLSEEKACLQEIIDSLK